MMLDIDSFKLYNGFYDNRVGDECLKSVSTAIPSSLNRAADLVARYGGEDFVVILPNVDKEKPYNFRNKIESLKIDHNPRQASPFITANLGTSSAIPTTGSSYDSLIKNADKALFHAKKEGKNRVKSQLS